ncbi:unnamed protein product [Phytophthora lilii]|uniref:Unnamed protein product n=1 Tax=Phytophthora lilii TaxID=2077276 RepID=A0A9W6X101_9STRA|nr:unnamed protein product [Phytophthora lilii]
MSFGGFCGDIALLTVCCDATVMLQIAEIKAAKPRGVSVEVDVQRPSGAFGLDFIAQFQNIYANVTNILVKVVPPDASPDALNNSLMISSHYDAAIGGAAASDDGVNIAIMMELLRMFVLNPPKHATLVFNFNGAEETIMQAAHGFITQHPWTDTIRAFINLEAAGAGGRELLFQTGSDELALAYAQGAKYPHASIIAQELFQSGIIPADTDYRIYRDFGYVAGMDFAYIANGYVYHTTLDDVSRIQQGAVQRLGENVVGVVNQLGGEPGRLKRVAENPQSSNTFFSDVMGLTMVAASKETTFVLCGGVFLLAVFYLLLSHVTLSERLTAFMLITQCFGAAIASSLTVGVLLSLSRILLPSSEATEAGSEHLHCYNSAVDCICIDSVRSCVGVWLMQIFLTVAWFSDCSNPYSDICPKRIMLQHVQREVVLPNGDVQTDSGLWINSLDFRGPDPIKNNLASTQWKDARVRVAPEELHEHAEVYGHMPWSLPVKHMLPEDKSWYLPAVAPAIPSSAPKAKSMGNGVSGPVAEAEDAYILQFCSGTVPSTYHFWIEAESNNPIDVAFVGHYLEVTTSEMKEFFDVLPSWTVVASAVSTWTKVQI